MSLFNSQKYVGATIATFDLRNINDTVELVKKEDVQAKGWALNVTSEESITAGIDEVESQLRPSAVFIDCAGIVGSRPVLMENYANFWKTMEVNTGIV